MALGAVVLYLSFPVAVYNFDGVACAIAVELGDLRHLAHGNHLAYGALGFAWYNLWRVFGYSGPAVQSLQVLSSLLSAAAIGVFCRLLQRAGLRPVLAATAAAGLAVSSLYWRWSLEAQVYPLGALFLFLAAREALRERPDPIRLGAWHASAVLGHVGHAMFLPAAAWSLWTAAGRGKNVGRFREEGARYAAVLCGTVLAAYITAAILWVRPQSWRELAVWLLGSAALGVDRSFAWVGGYSVQGFGEWARAALRLFGGGPWVGGAVWALATAGAAITWRRERRLAAICLLWLAGYAVLFTCWHPGQPVYRFTDMAPLWLLAALGCERLDGRLRRMPGAAAWALAAGVAALGLWNLEHVIIPGGDPGRNADLQRALWIERETPENAWVVVAGVDQVYVPYFGHRKPLNVRYFEGRPEALREFVDRLGAAKEPVYAVARTLPPQWAEWLKAQPSRAAAGRDDDDLVLISPTLVPSVGRREASRKVRATHSAPHP